MNQSQKPEPGDLIEIFRDNFQHWAVYVGDGYVVHVTSPPGAVVPCGDSRSLLSVPGAVSNTLMSVSTEKAMVRKQKLREVVGDNTWRINNSLDKENKPRPAHIIVEEALSQVGNEMEYNFIMKNCEHFVNKLRYGRDVSWQVGEKAKLIFMGAAMGAIVATGGTIAAASALALAFLLRK
ncbi:phospholipase A and acyltransferase 4-like [Acanthopagrus schlegelii]